MQLARLRCRGDRLSTHGIASCDFSLLSGLHLGSLGGDRLERGMSSLADGAALDFDTNDNCFAGSETQAKS